MLRNAVTRSSSRTSPRPAAPGCIGETVPQNGQTSACFAGDHSAAPPQAGHAKRSRAVTSLICRAVAALTASSAIQELVQRRARDAVAGANLLRLQLPSFH